METGEIKGVSVTTITTSISAYLHSNLCTFAQARPTHVLHVPIYSNLCTPLVMYTAPGLVKSLRVTSVNVTNITIQWDRVDCQQRNGRTDSYTVVHFPTSDSYYGRYARTVSGVSDRMFTVTGLPPRTSYMFQVRASNPVLDVRGEVANLTVNTSTPQGESGLVSHSM